jgi:hypothetical protein
MATSPEYLRLAASSSRVLADTALDGLGTAVVVVDARHKHLPVILANASARRCLTAVSDVGGLVETPLHRWLTAGSVSAVESLLATADIRSLSSCVLAWRFAEGEASVLTDLKYLPSSPGQRLFMLTFAALAPESGLVTAMENMPFDVLVLDGDLKVTYANARARLTGVSRPGGVLG